MSESALKAFELLFHLARSGDSSLAKLARETGWDKATALRYLTAMEKKGVVERRNGDWTLGLALVELASRVPVSSNIASRAEPILVELARSTGETANLSALTGFEIMYVARAEGGRSLRLRSNPGDRLPLYCTAGGKAVLSRMIQALRTQYIAEAKLIAYTPHTITDPVRLSNEIDETIKRGWAIDDEEFEQGLICYALPIEFPRFGFLGAVSVSGPASRMQHGRNEILAALRWTVTCLHNEINGGEEENGEPALFAPGHGGFKSSDWHRPGSETFE